MTRFLLLVLTLLFLSSGPVYAEWVEIGDTDEFSVYVDPDTIRRKGDLVKMWNLIDYKTAQASRGSSFLSLKGQQEYDCAEERVRAIASTTFLGNMGSGKVDGTDSNESNWSPVSPDSTAKGLWKFACKK